MINYFKGDIMKKQFEEYLNDLGIKINDEQYKQFEKYFELLIEWNEKINLTAITERDDVYLKHFYDSLTLTKIQDFSNQSLLDVGSGAGFPSIPLKIIFPDLKVTIIDALNKRINFLKLLTEALDLDVTLIHGRAEDQKEKENYDLVTARAVANLNVLSELCLPFVNMDGSFLIMKGSKGEEELKYAKRAVELLGGKHVQTIAFHLKEEMRTLIKVEKVRNTPKKYPRQFKMIKNKPL